LSQASSAAAGARARLVPLDLLRVVAPVCVVIIHVSAATLLGAPPDSLGYAVAGFLNQACRVGLPAFLMVSGAGMFYAYGQRQDFSWRRYLLRRLQAVGIPYVAWTLVYFLFFRIVEQNFDGLIPGFLHALATASAVYTFYFFIPIAQWYLLFPFVRPLARSRWLGPVTVAALVVNGLVIVLSFPAVRFDVGNILSTLWPYRARVLLWWLGPFFLGAWLATRWESASRVLRRYWGALLLLAAPLLVWVLREFQAYVQVGRLSDVATVLRPSVYAYALVVVLAIIGLGTVLCERSAFIARAVGVIRQYSFGVYLIHPLIMHFTRKFLDTLNIGALVYLALNLLLVLALSYLAVSLIARVPMGHWLIGIRPPRRVPVEGPAPLDRPAPGC